MQDGAPPGPPGGVEEWRAVSRVLKSPVELVRTVYEDLVTTFFPGDCSACGGPLLKVGSTSFCDSCIDALTAQTGTLCACCGEALDFEGVRVAAQFGREGLLCSPCRLAPPQFERAAAWGLYEDGMRELIHLLKYERMQSAAEPLGELLARTVKMLRDGDAAMGRDAVVVAVPLYPAKQRQRGYNQSVLLADVALRELKREGTWNLRAAHGAMVRTRDTESQFGLTPGGRRRNLRGAFEVIDPAVVAGREVLLVDDIYTTGATARECARVLRQAGAAQVWVATVARAQREMVASWDAKTWDAKEAAETAVWDAG